MVRGQFDTCLDKVFGFADLVAAMPEGKVFDAEFLGSARQFATLQLVVLTTIRVLAYTLTTGYYHRQIRSHCRKRPPSFCEMARTLALALFAADPDTG